MSKLKCNLSRRDFLTLASLAGGAAMAANANHFATAADEPQTVPTRPFGKSGIQVPILSLGGSLNTSMSPLLLRQAAAWGVTYWDTAHSYMGGNSERGIGKYLARFAEERKKIFLVSKSHAWTLDGMSSHLDESLERMQTDYIDLFFVHGINAIGDIDDDTRKWAEKAKSAGKIRLFGFSTHSNMAACLLGAATLGWVDGIMLTYNFRLMHDAGMQRAVEACANAGIGLTAMKTQGGGQVKTNSETELELAGRFLRKGYTDAQAKLKAVWQNPLISSICSEMPNMTILMSNVAAALNRTALSVHDFDLLRHYARETRAGYCAGCTGICEAAMGGSAPIGDVMRALMYCRSYGNHARGLAEFKKIPAHVRARIATLDFSVAQQKCPHQMAIGKLITEAFREFA